MDGWGDSPSRWGFLESLEPFPAGELFHQDGLPQQLGRAVAGAVAGAAQSVGWLGGWLGDISMVHGFFWKTPW